MKKILTLSLLLLTYGAMAQQRPYHRQSQKAFQELSPEQRATLQSKKMVLALDLDTRQQQQVESLLKKRFETREKMRATHRKAAADSSKSLTPEARYGRMNAHLDREIAFQQEMKNILTESQFEDWKKRQGAKKRAYHQGRKQQRQRKGMHKPHRD
jgi:hypothetical protein